MHTSHILNALHTVLRFMHGRNPTHGEMVTTGHRIIRRIRERVWS